MVLGGRRKVERGPRRGSASGAAPPPARAFRGYGSSAFRPPPRPGQRWVPPTTRTVPWPVSTVQAVHTDFVATLHL